MTVRIEIKVHNLCVHHLRFCHVLVEKEYTAVKAQRVRQYFIILLKCTTCPGKNCVNQGNQIVKLQKSNKIVN